MTLAHALVDLGEARGLSTATLELCNVQSVGREHDYGVGWLWDTYTLEGVKAQRWKSAYSQRPEGATNWAKYRWFPTKPDGNASYFDPDGKLRQAVKDQYGFLFIVGGEIAAMTMFDAGFRNTTCFFGDESIPKQTLYADMKRLGVDAIMMIPDRDLPGQKCAVTVRDLLKDDLDFEFTVKALPYELTDKHGQDVNDWWLDLKRDRDALREGVDLLATWKLPEPKPTVIEFPTFSPNPDSKLPPRFVEAVLRDVESRATPNKAFRYDSEGWSSNFRCPFHDDQEASAGFNKESMSFKCFACGAKSAKQYGEGVGIHLKDYFDDPVPTVKPSTNGANPTPTPVVKPPAKLLRPVLPPFARLTPEQEREASRGRDWLNDYMDWAVDASPLTPRSFHEAMALWLLATVSTRRMHCRIGAEDIYPNLYVLIVGKTTIYRKSTAMKLVKSVLHRAGLSALLLPSDVTPEALFDELAGVKPVNFETLPADAKDRWVKGRAVAAQRSFMKDEASSIFASLKRDYMAGLSELLLQGYDGDSGTLDKRLKSKGIITVKDLCLSFLGATTPIMYAKYVGNEERENGFAARFAIITPDRDMQYRAPSDQTDIPPSVILKIGNLFRKVLPWHGDKEPSASVLMEEVQTPPSMHVMFSPGAFESLNNYRRALGWDMPLSEAIDDSKAASYARLGTMAFKVAMLLAAVDADERPVRIEDRHAYAAQMIVEEWRESLHRLDQDIAKSKAVDNDDNKVLELIRQSGLYGVTMREIMQACNIRPRAKAIDALTVLADDGLIEKFDRKPDGRGRPTVCYRASGIAES
jgi:hypothetical protein